MKKRSALYPVVLSALAAMVLAACVDLGLGGTNDGANGGGGAGQGYDSLELLSLPQAALIGIANSPDPEDPEAQEAALEMAANANLAMVLAQLYVALAFAGWDPSLPAVYESGGVTFSWFADGDTVTWSYSYGSGGEAAVIVIEVTDNGATWDVSVTVDGDTLLSGTVAEGGGSGSVRSYPVPANPDNSILVVWGPAAAPYELTFTVTRYAGGDTAVAELTVATTLDGAAGEWLYAAPPGSTPAGNDWP